jgi:hypothetical protein
VGGRNKDHSQIKNLEDSFLAVDDIEVGFKNKIPLYLFGFFVLGLIAQTIAKSNF